MVPKEVDGEQLEDALARVRRCIGGGTAKENTNSDSDLEMVADSITVNLRCPVSHNIHSCMSCKRKYIFLLATQLHACMCILSMHPCTHPPKFIIV